MSNFRRSRAWEVVVPLALAAAALFAAHSLGSVVAIEVPFFAAVVASLWLGGPLSGLIAVVSCSLAILYFFLPPPHALHREHFHIILELAGFFAISSLLVLYVKRLAAVRDLLAATFRSIDEAVIITDGRGVIEAMNPAAEALTGWRERSARGSLLGGIVVLRDRQTRAALEPAALAVLRGETPGEPWRPKLLIQRSGKEVLVEEASALISARGRASGVVLILRDVTERETLNAHIQESERMQSVGRLAAGIAHQFNNLLLQVTGFADLASSTLPEDHKARPLLRMVIEASERAAKLVRQLLGLSGKGRFVSERIDLAEFVRGNAELILAAAPQNIRISIETSPNGAHIAGDPVQFQQVLMNLVENAIEAIGPGNSGEIRVRTGTETVPGSTAPAYAGYELAPGTYGCLEVRDTGSGMDENTVSRVFEPFFTTKALGRGLGLAAVHGIVRSYGGAVGVQTALGAGSAFKVLLPLAD